MNLGVILYYCEIIWLSFNCFPFEQKSLLQHRRKKPFDLYCLNIINFTENTPVRGMLLTAAEGSDWQPHFTEWEGRVFRAASWQQLSSVKDTGQANPAGQQQCCLAGDVSSTREFLIFVYSCLCWTEL